MHRRVTLALAGVVAISGAVVSLPVASARPSALAATPCRPATGRPWCDIALSADQRAQLLEARMTTTEKIDFLNGIRPGPHTGASFAIPRLGIPTIYYTDGPVGPRQGIATAMPTPMAVAATFDPSDAFASGNEIGTEAREKGNEVVFGPTVNIMRTPQGGRTFEAYGEDPFLVAATTVGWIDGAQSAGVMADVKHFAANNQEGQIGAAPIFGVDGSRVLVDARVSQRVLHEVYFPQFEAAVKQAHVASVMCSYNRINGTYACENSWLLKQTLKGQWGFKGYVLSDYGAAHNTVANLNGGLDFEPSFAVPVPQLSSYYAPEIEAALTAHQVSMATIDEHVFRILRTWFQFGVFDRPVYTDDESVINRRADAEVAERVEQDAIVLLKNDADLLPLDPSKVGSVAVIGPYADRFITGGGSGDVTPSAKVTALAGIERQLSGTGTTVRYASGSSTAAAVAAAKASNVAVVVVGDVESEGQDKSCVDLNCNSDRADTAVPSGTYSCDGSCPPNGSNEDALISAVAAANHRTIVVLETGAPVLTPWRSQVAGLLEAWYPGQAGGTAIARVLFGAADPRGRLPVTFPNSAAQLPTAGSPAKYPGVGIEESYQEGLDIGYRWYAAHHFVPAYPFGYGLSYTRFGLSGMRLRSVGSGDGTVATVSVRVTDLGRRAGRAVPELYLSLPGTAARPEPPLQLAGYRGVELEPGGSATVTFNLDARSLANYVTGAARWEDASGCFAARVGSSATSLPLQGAFELGPASCGAGAVRLSIRPGAADEAAVVPPAATVRWSPPVR
jgi:beta-glucosidase